MKTRLFILCIYILFTSTLSGQQTLINRAGKNFQQLFDQYPQEKIYLHLDKSTYTAGETIWLKAYLTDATFHIPNLLSKYIYVELINRQDSVCQQIKLRQTDSCFFGNFRLGLNIKPGDYCVRAYTSWMQNQDEAFFFKKNIVILNPTVDVNIHTGSKQNENSMQTTLTLVNSSGQPYAGQRLKVVLRKKDGVIKKTTIRTDDKGQGVVVYPVSDSIDNLVVSFPYDLPFAFNQTIYPPEISGDFDLQFFPEGGNLLAGTRQRIAFKAIGRDGGSVETSGLIYDSHDKPISHFKSAHRGMGTVSFFVQPGERYYAEASLPNNSKKRIELPVPIDSGYALEAVWQADTSILLSVLKANASSSPTPLYLLIHTRGQLINILPISEDFVGSIAPRQFPDGISHFVLIDSLGNIFSERLCFFAPDLTDLTLELKTNKAQYDRRELVQLSLQLPSSDTTFPAGNFSVAVTDNSMVKKDSLSHNIISYFLLTSDLKGYIEAPGSYIHETPETTDLLMLTHGWTRFNIKNILQGKIPKSLHPLELAQQLRGQVTNISNKPAPNAKVQVFIPAQQTIGELKTDLLGNFTIRNIEFCDSTLFMVRGYKEKGGKYVNIKMDSLQAIQPHTFFPKPPGIKEEPADKFIQRFQGDYYYQDGVKIYILAEANVLRRRPSRTAQKYTGEYTDMADQILGQEELSKFSATTIFQLLMRLPGVYVSGENVSIRGQGTPLFLLDGTPVESDFIGDVAPDDVDNVGIIKDGARLSFFGSQGGNGVIIINTKHGVAGIRPTPGLIKFFPKGYLQPDEFYMPAYDRPEEKNKPEIDYRSTIYWQPNVFTDFTGHAEVSFYTADFPSTYTVTVEGMTCDGKIYRGQKLIDRK